MRCEIGRNRPAEPPVVYMQRRNMSTRDVGRNTAPGRFDFGKFGHDMKLDRMPGTRCAVRPGRTPDYSPLRNRETQPIPLAEARDDADASSRAPP